jgi:DnaK suppressor protein
MPLVDKANKKRNAELKKMLEARRKELTRRVTGMLKDVRVHGGHAREASVEPGEPDADIQPDVDLALIQMKTETLARIDGALRRLKDGEYGDCVECGNPISKQRLEALPFAVRCKECEEQRETVSTRGRVPVYRRAYGTALDAVE